MTVLPLRRGSFGESRSDSLLGWSLSRPPVHFCHAAVVESGVQAATRLQFVVHAAPVPWIHSVVAFGGVARVDLEDFTSQGVGLDCPGKVTSARRCSAELVGA